MNSKVVFVLFLYLTVNNASYYNTEKLVLGGIFYEDSNDLSDALELSAKNSRIETSTNENFDVKIETVPRDEILRVGSTICELVKNKVIGIIDGTSGASSDYIQAVCDMLEIPHVLVTHNELKDNNLAQLNLYPSAITYNTLLEQIITYKDWRNFTILYVKGHSMNRAEALMKMGNDTDRYVVALRELSGDDYRDVLTNAKDNGFTNFVVDCPSNRLELVLSYAQQVGLMADEHSYIFLSPDLFTLDLNPYRYGGVNMTGFRLVDLKKNQKLWDFTTKFNQQNGNFLTPEQVQTEVFLVADAVEVFAEAVRKVNVTMEELDCDNVQPWLFGSSLLNFMRTNKIEGLTRTLNFNGFGQRTDFVFDVLELTPAGNQTIGQWKNGQFVENRPIISSGDINEESIMRNKTFKILISTTPPYGYKTESTKELTGNDRFEGFTIDLIKQVANLLGFDYEFEEEKDYGSVTNGKWNGMVLQLIEERADFAICDFTITSNRQRAIDFSTPFMTLGIGILYKEPSKQPPDMFSFMTVFSTEVWINMVFWQIGLGVLMIVVGRLSHKEWQNPVPCVEQPEELTNQFSFANSVWLIIGSVMQQGSEVAPIAPAPRLITSVWWFFTMVMVALYTGQLVAFLTVESNVMPFNNVDDLYKAKSIEYGAKQSGSTIDFFKNSGDRRLKAMYQQMEKKHWLVKENVDGVARAENSSYAFFMESASIEYYVERHCDLRQVGGTLDTKSYGIGMKKGSEYRKYIDTALLHLKETGVIQKLKDSWWKDKRGGGKCHIKKDEEVKQLGMKNMLGSFVVLGVGCLFGLLISILDMLWGVFKRSVKYSTPFRYELIEELKFALTFSGDVKPVKRPDRTGTDRQGSADALAEVQAKDEIKSLRSVKSTSTHRTYHSHSSRHSSKSHSIAFARRRKYT